MNGQPTEAGPDGDSGFTGTLKEETGHLKEVVKEEAGHTGAKLKEEAKAAFTRLKGAGQRLAESRKDQLSDKAGEFAAAAAAAAERLREGDSPNVLSGPAEAAACGLEQLASYLKEKDPAEILDGLGQWSRRRPELVFGGLFLAGLVTARFLKASSRTKSELSQEVKDASWKRDSPGFDGAKWKQENVQPPTQDIPSWRNLDNLGSTTPLPGRPPSYSDADAVYPGSEPSPAAQIYNPALT